MSEQVTYPGFGYFDWDGDYDSDHFYVPTSARLELGGDWY